MNCVPHILSICVNDLLGVFVECYSFILNFAIRFYVVYTLHVILLCGCGHFIFTVITQYTFLYLSLYVYLLFVDYILLIFINYFYKVCIYNYFYLRFVGFTEHNLFENYLLIRNKFCILHMCMGCMLFSTHITCLLCLTPKSHCHGSWLGSINMMPICPT